MAKIYPRKGGVMQRYKFGKSSGKLGGAWVGKHINTNPDGDVPRKKLKFTAKKGA